MERGETLKVTPAVGVVIFSPDFRRVLLVEHTEAARQPTGVYGLPGGRVELGESERYAAARELEEETGYAVDPETLEEFEGNTREKVLELKQGPESFHFKVFVARSFSGRFTPTEKTIPRWVLVEKLHDFNHEMLPNIPDIVDSAFAHLKIGK